MSVGPSPVSPSRKRFRAGWAIAIATVLVAMLALVPAVDAAGGVHPDAKKTIGMEMECTPNAAPGIQAGCTLTLVKERGIDPHPTGMVELTAVGGETEFPNGNECEPELKVPTELSCLIIYKPLSVGRGERVLTGTYIGDRSYEPASQTATVVVVRTPVVAASCTPINPKVGQATDCNAVVNDDPTATGKRAPTGELIFSTTQPGSFPNGSRCPLIVTGATTSICNFGEKYTPEKFNNGHHKIRVVYQPDVPNFLGEFGTASVNPQRSTTASLTCGKTTASKEPVNCHVVVTDTTEHSVVSRVAPSGKVQFTTSGAGAFSHESACTLVAQGQESSSCDIAYLPSSSNPTIHRITASYGGEPERESAAASTPITVTGGITRFAAPSGAGSAPCTEASSPCTLVKAARAAKAGDEVLLAPGAYVNADLGETGTLKLKAGIRLSGEPGKGRPRIQYTENEEITPALIVGADDVVSDLRIDSTKGGEFEGEALRSVFEIDGGLVEGVIVRTETAEAACEVDGGLLRDSVCLDTGQKGAGIHAVPLLIEAGSPVNATIDFRNVTAIASGALGTGIELGAESSSGTPKLAISGRDVIAQGGDEAIHGRSNGTGPAAPSVVATFDHSNFATSSTTTSGGGSISLTAAGSNNNQTIPPSLAADGFHQLAGSVTIDEGVSDGLTGAHDVEGKPRTLGASIDIGADEFGPASTTLVNCAPRATVGGSVPCTVTVSDTAATGATAPHGFVGFESSGAGSFRAVEGHAPVSGCTLSTFIVTLSICQVEYTPTKIGSQAHTITAHYGLNGDHGPSEDSTDIAVGNASETKLSCAPNPIEVQGTAAPAPATCVAVVTDASSEPQLPLTGKVSFENGAPGQFTPASCEIQALGEGKFGCESSYQAPTPSQAHETFGLKASYEGDVAHSSSSGSFQLSVDGGTPITRTSLSCAPSTIETSESSICTVTVRDETATPTTPIGGVTFTSTGAGTVEGSCDLSQIGEVEGEAGCEVGFTPVSPLSVGAGKHDITAEYEGNGSHLPGAATATVEVSARTATAIHCSVETLAAHEAVNCNATVTDESAEGGQLVEGEVEFKSDGEGAFSSSTCTLAPVGPANGCEVIYTPNAPGSGSHLITAVYKGGGFHRASSGSLALKIADPSTTSIECVPATLRIGDLSSCVVTVKDPVGGPAPRGEIEASSGAVGQLSGEGHCKLGRPENGEASCVLTYKPEVGGEHTITAEYLGDPVHGNSFAKQTLEVPTVGDETKTSLTCEQPVAPGQASNCEATVTDLTAPQSTPTGKVVFASSGKGDFGSEGSCVLEIAGAAAKCHLTYTPRLSAGGGFEEITASYTADATRLPSQASFQLHVVEQRAATTTRLVCDPGSIRPGEDTECTATVVDQGSAVGAATGKVGFSLDRPGVTLAAESCDLTENGANKASCQVAVHADSPISRSAGGHDISAFYAGDSVHAISDDSAHFVVSQPVSASLACVPRNLKIGATSACTITVEDTSGADAAAPSGEVALESSGAGAFTPAANCLLEDPTQSSASCELTFTPKAPGAAHIVAAYAGDIAHPTATASTDLAVELEAGGAGDTTTTAIACDPAPVAALTSTTCTATVTDPAPGATTPTGEARFTSDANGELSPQTCPLTGSGASASCSVSYTPAEPGTHHLRAAYPGDLTHQLSGSDPLDLTVEQAPGGDQGHATRTRLACEPTTLLVGAVSHCRASVKDLAANATTPEGQVSFAPAGDEFSAPACTLHGSGDHAGCEVDYSPAAPGLPILRAFYQGDATHRGSEGSTSMTIESTINGGDGNPTSAAVACDPAPATVLEATTCTATVTDTAEAAMSTPHGLAKFHSDAAGTFSAPTCELQGSGGTATCTVEYTPTAPGVHNLSVSYAGDPQHRISASQPLGLEVEAAAGGNGEPTSTAVLCQPNPATAGAATTCTATVENADSAATAPPVGQVRFAPESGEFSSQTCNATGSGRVATCSVEYTPVAPGPRQLTATYGGDSAHQGSVSAPFELLVRVGGGGGEGGQGDRTSTAIVCAPPTLAVGAFTTCTATVTDTDSATSGPEGRVSFEPATAGGGEFIQLGCTLSGSGNTTSCGAEYRPAAPGAQTLVASYPGDGHHQQSGGQTQITVETTTGGGTGDATATTVECQPQAFALGATTSCEATVTDLAGAGAPTPGGVVSFANDGAGAFAAPATCPLTGSGNTAGCALSFEAPAPGAQAITATYGGDATHQSSPSAAFPITVETTSGGGTGAATTTTLACLPTTLVLSGNSNCTATVTSADGSTTPSGKVSFSSNAKGKFAGEEACLLNGNGASASCSLAYTPEAPGTHLATASYVGDAGHQISSSDPVSLTVKEQGSGGGEDETKTEVLCTPQRFPVSDFSDCTATVEDVVAGADAPGGLVDFSSSPAGSFNQSSCELSNPSGPRASCDVRFEAAEPGRVTVTGVYNGTRKRSEGSFDVEATQGSGGGNGEVTATSFSCEPSPATVGAASTCTVSVADTDEAAHVPGGTVSFAPFDGQFSAESCVLVSAGDSSVCTVEYTPTAPGIRTLHAHYGGDDSHQGSDGALDLGVEVTSGGGNGDATSTAIACPATTVGTASTCTATVTDTASSTEAPTGDVSFAPFDSQLSAETCHLGAGAANVATCTVEYTPTAPGVRTLHAHYAGDGSRQGSDGEVDLSVEVTSGGGNGDATATSLACLPDPGAVGAASTCTATVTDTASATDVPTGEVSFSPFDGQFSSETCTLNGAGTCTVQYTPTAPGIRSLTAAYTGDGTRQASASDPLLLDVEVSGGGGGGKDATTTGLACSPDALATSASSTCVVTVEDTTGATATTPGGRVEFASDKAGAFTAAATCVLAEVSAGKAACELGYRPTVAGVHTITASYGGDQAHDSSGGSDEITATLEAPERGETATSVQCIPTTVKTNEASICAVKVSDESATPTTPAGQVEFATNSAGFFSGAAVCDLNGVAGSKEAGCQIEYTPVQVGSGTHQVFATYEDAGHRLSQGHFGLTVGAEATPKNPTGTELACEPAALPAGTETTCTVTVGDEAEPAGARTTPSGTVKFETAAAGIFTQPATCALVAGDGAKASCTIKYTPELTGDSQALFATYEGDAGHSESQGTSVVKVVDPTAAKLVCAPGALAAGAPTTCTVTVEDTTNLGTEPAAKVSFKSDGQGAFSEGGACTLAHSAAKTASCSLTYTPAAPGAHKVTATYEGDPSHQESSATAQVDVTDPTVATLACAPSALALGAAPTASTCTVTVKDAAAAAAPAGEVKFASDGPGAFSAPACTLAGGACKVTYTPSAAGSGTHKISAAYQGSAVHHPSQASTTVTVAAAKALPDTIIGKHPPKRTPAKTAAFTFSSDQSPVSFQCQLDKGAFVPCKSPFNTKTLKLKKVGKGKKKKLKPVFKLKNGVHVLQVRAVNAAGQADPTPATYQWTVGKKKTKKHKKH